MDGSSLAIFRMNNTIENQGTGASIEQVYKY